ncbi:MAG: hypothetical protein J07AB43_02630 [Candidatus Nanosalina sp. J07AB43]|nr:MAG: hypothetical protein J07AB43_02630 [Candidatus Nanosalina sp. J07AB43]
MSDIDQSKIEMWREKGLTLRSRLNADPPPVDRDDIPQSTLQNKIERGDVIQELRLRFYPSIGLTERKNDYYAGSFRGSIDEFEDKAYSIGYRNNPTAYVEIIDGLGPDDGSYARIEITESQEFPYLGFDRPFGIVTWWNRVKEQNHLTTFIDEEEDLVHIFVHKEASAWLQPIRHATVSEGDNIGAKEFTLRWEDNYEQLEQVEI